MASYTFVDSATLIQETAVSSHVIPVPAATADGDLLIAILFLDVAPNTVTAPGAFTVEPGDGDISEGGGIGEIAWRIASSEPADYTFTNSPSATCSVGVMLAYRGGDTATPFNANALGVGGSPTSTFPDITTTDNGCIILQTIMADNPNAGGVGDYTLPTDYTDRCNIQNVAQRNNVAVFEVLQVSAGLVTGVQTTYTGGSSAAAPIVSSKALGPSLDVSTILTPHPIFRSRGGG